MQNKLKEEEKRLLKSGSKSVLFKNSGVAFLALKNLYVYFNSFQKLIFSQFYIWYHFIQSRAQETSLNYITFKAL